MARGSNPAGDEAWDSFGQADWAGGVRRSEQAIPAPVLAVGEGQLCLIPQQNSLLH